MNGLESAFRFFQCLDCRGELLAEPWHDAGEVVPLGRLEALQRRDEPRCECFHVRQGIGRQGFFLLLNPSLSPFSKGDQGDLSMVLDPRSSTSILGRPDGRLTVDRRLRHVQLGCDLDLYGSNLESGVLCLRDEGEDVHDPQIGLLRGAFKFLVPPGPSDRACMRQGLQAAAGLPRRCVS